MYPYCFTQEIRYFCLVDKVYGMSGIPTKFIVDKAGMIRFKHTGFSGGPDAVVDEISMMIDMANEPAR